VKRTFAGRSYDVTIGIDSMGIAKGFGYSRDFDVPLVYISFEIFFHDELLSDQLIGLKEEECIASRHADLVIIQDRQRAQLLAKENGLEMERFEYLPVSPRGPLWCEKSDFLRRRFDIPEDTMIVLHSGSFSEWTYPEELLESVASWSGDFTLVIHTRYRGNRYVQMFEDARLPNVVLSTLPLPTEEYEYLVSSADIGLLLYKPTPPSPYDQKNIREIGLSSGKFAFYMKHGIPAISVDQLCYARLLADYGFGENLGSFREMPGALRRIRSNYDFHRTEAQRLFSEKLDFDIHWPRVSDRLLAVMR